MSPGIVHGTSRTQGHALTNCATLAPSARAQASSVKRLSRALNHARGHFRLLPASLHGLSFSIQEIFACGIRDPELWDSEYNLLNPESREWLKSRIQILLTKNLESGIHSVGSRNPRLSWILLHGSMWRPLYPKREKWRPLSQRDTTFYCPFT